MLDIHRFATQPSGRRPVKEMLRTAGAGNGIGRARSAGAVPGGPIPHQRSGHSTPQRLAVRRTGCQRTFELDRAQRLAMLASRNLGRVAVNVAGWPPVIRPVSYVFDQSTQCVAFRCAQGSKFSALVLAGEAA